MATYVLVHGAAHGGWCWKPVAQRLRAAGHEVHTPTLTGLGERRHLVGPHVDLELHITDVANVLVHEDLREVILVGHSYAGMVITGVADRALDRVARLVYLDAAQPRNGESIADITEAVERSREAGRVVDGVELILWPTNGHTYGVTDPATSAWMLKRLAPHPWRTFEQKLVLRDETAVLSLPRTSITCPETLDRRPTAVWARALDADEVWYIDSGHDLMLTEPDQVADLLLRLGA